MHQMLFKFSASMAIALTILLSGTYIPAGDNTPAEVCCTEEVSIFESEPPKIEPEKIPEEEIPETLSKDDIELLALVTMAEAEAEPEEGQRLVIDTILNRVDSEHFPDTVYDVVYQKNQFTSMWNGRTSRCTIRDDLVELVKEELENRTDKDVIFFRTGRYSDYGEPMRLVGHHYFSKY